MRWRSITVTGALVLATAGFGIGELERGNRLYRDGRYEEAVAAYRQALEGGEDSAVLQFNMGTALLRLGRYAEAEPYLQAALDVVDPAVRAPALFNMGSRFLEEGRASTDPEARSRLLDGAVEAYRRALRLDPSWADAKWNYELALRARSEMPQQGGGRSRQDRPPQESREDRSPEQREESPGEPPEAGTMTREQAERLLAAVEQNERDLVREKLRKGRRETRVARDW